jgi:hypothetical protein
MTVPLGPTSDMTQIMTRLLDDLPPPPPDLAGHLLCETPLTLCPTQSSLILRSLLSMMTGLSAGYLGGCDLSKVLKDGESCVWERYVSISKAFCSFSLRYVLDGSGRFEARTLSVAES